MPDITLQPMPVLVDGGSHDGRLVLADGSLVAVFARVSPPRRRVARAGPETGFWRRGSDPAAT